MKLDHSTVAKMSLALTLCWPFGLASAQAVTNVQTAPAKPFSVEATAINAHAFRLHVSFAEAPAKQQSLCIDANSSNPRRVTFAWDEAARTLSWAVDGPCRGKDIFKGKKSRCLIRRAW